MGVSLSVNNHFLVPQFAFVFYQQNFGKNSDGYFSGDSVGNIKPDWGVDAVEPSARTASICPGLAGELPPVKVFTLLQTFGTETRLVFCLLQMPK